MKLVKHITLQLQMYHDDVIARVILDNGEESALYSLPEIDNLLQVWKAGELMGSFAIGTILADNVRITFREK